MTDLIKITGDLVIINHDRKQIITCQPFTDEFVKGLREQYPLTRDMDIMDYRLTNYYRNPIRDTKIVNPQCAHL